MDRPSDHADGLVELVDQRRASDVNVDRIGETDRQFAHLLSARHDDGVVAGGAGVEERDRAEAEEIIRWRSEPSPAAASAALAASARSRRKAAVSNGSSTGTGLAAILAKRSPVARLRFAIAAGKSACWRESIDVELHGGRVPIDVGRGNAWALHLLRGRGNDARGEREARYSESAQHDAPHLAGAVVATSGLDWSIAAEVIPAKTVKKKVPQCCKSAAATLIASRKSVLGALDVGAVRRHDHDLGAGADEGRDHGAHAVRQHGRLVGGGGGLAFDRGLGFHHFQGRLLR